MTYTAEDYRREAEILRALARVEASYGLAVSEAISDRRAAMLEDAAERLEQRCETCYHVRAYEVRPGMPEYTCCDRDESNPMHWQDTDGLFSCKRWQPQEPR